MDRAKLLSSLKNLEQETSLICLQEVDSTNNYIKSNMPQNGTIAVTSDIQNGGKGRLSRSFSSPRGGLYLSIGFWPACLPSETNHLTALTGLAVKNAVEKVYGISPQIKWPNDLIFKGKKICGILLESVHMSDKFFIVAGIGLNISNPLPPELLDKADNLERLTGKSPCLEDMASALIYEFFSVMDRAFSEKEELLADYAKHCITIGQRVSASSRNEKLQGIARGIDSDAGLIIEKDNKETVTVISGEVTLADV